MSNIKSCTHTGGKEPGGAGSWVLLLCSYVKVTDSIGTEFQQQHVAIARECMSTEQPTMTEDSGHKTLSVQNIHTDHASAWGRDLDT